MKMFANERMSVDLVSVKSCLHPGSNLRQNLRFLPPDTEMRVPIDDAKLDPTIDLQEHWDYLIQDEDAQLRTKLESDDEHNSKFYEVRKGLINNVFDYGDSLSLRNITLQVAIVYIEKLMKICNIDILNKDINLWSIAALSLAAKYIELDDNVPRISELKEVIENKSYSRTIFVKCEKYLLRILDWDLMVITPLHFASCILNYSVLFGDDNIKIIDNNGKEAYRFLINKEQLVKTVQAIRKYTEFFADIAIQSYEIQKFKYSIQGLYAILAAREVLCIKPVWNKQFDSFTNLHKHEIMAQIREIKTIVNDSEIMKSLIEFCKTNVTSESIINTTNIDTAASIFEEDD